MKNCRISLAFNVHVKFSQPMSAISSSQRRMDKKLAQLQAKVRLKQDEAAAKALKKARYDNSCMITVSCLTAYLS